MQVRPQHGATDAPDEVEEVMMVVPIYGHIDEAQDVAEKDRHRFLQRAYADGVGRLQFEDHDGYDDGDHAITERDKPILFHRSSLSAAAYLAPALAITKRHAR